MCVGDGKREGQREGGTKRGTNMVCGDARWTRTLENSKMQFYNGVH